MFRALSSRRAAQVVSRRLRESLRRIARSLQRAAQRVDSGIRSPFGIPEGVLPRGDAAEPAEPLLRRFIPLPPAYALTSWFRGAPIVSNDGYDGFENCLILCVDHNPEPWQFAVEDAHMLLRDRMSLKNPPHTIVFASPAAQQTLRTVFRRHRRSLGLVIVSPSQAQRSALLGLATAFAVPGHDGAAADDAEARFITEALASGVPVISMPQEAPLPMTLDTAFRTDGSASARGARRAARMAALERLPDQARALVPFRPSSTRAPATVSSRPQRVLVAGHDLKFATPFIEALHSDGHLVTIDPWDGHARHDPERSTSLLEQAHVIWCEWTLGNAVWYSQRKRHDQRLVTRLHLQEATTGFPRAVRWNNVDACIVVAEHVRRLVVRDAAVPEAKSLMIPNAVRVPDAVPQKDPETRFTIGLVGMSPARKGLREALDILARLREHDARFRLSLRGRLPEEYPWLQARPDELQYFAQEFERLDSDSLLRGAVDFSPFGDDMGSWYSGVGVVLSTSDFESFHFSIPDGAVHGALPRMLNWAGADALYPHTWMHASAAAAAASIVEATQDPARWASECTAARRFVAEHYGAEVIVPEFVRQLMHQ